MPGAQRLRRLVLAAVAFVTAATVAIGQAPDAPPAQPTAILAAIEGPIGPATTHHLEKVIAQAASRRAEVLILRLDTPGGLADSMRDIISDILASPTPVVGYVAPPGAHAASAGTYILYATHVAAMAPGTNLGAATPVSIGGLPGAPRDNDPADRSPRDSDGTDGGRPDDGEDRGRIGSLSPDEAMNAKATNDAVAFIRSLAELHGRNADWAERAVREAASLSSAKALEEGVIDLIAANTDDLLEAIDGRKVLIGGVERVLSTRGVQIEQIEMDAITRVLSVLSNPNVALILMMIGVYGLIFEFWNPGAIVPGVVGAISLTLGLYALNQLPLNYAGLALLGLGIAFMLVEALTPSFGIMGFGGLVAFVIGAAMLIDTDVPEYRVSWWVIGTMAGLSGSVLVLLLGYTLRAYRHPVLSGSARMHGTEGRVLEWSGDGGYVLAEGERWRARGATGLAANETVRIRNHDGLTLIVDRTADLDQRADEGAGTPRREGES